MELVFDWNPGNDHRLEDRGLVGSDAGGFSLWELWKLAANRRPKTRMPLKVW